MFNIGFSEMILLAVLVLVLIGPKQLPEIARGIGRILNELKRGQESFVRDVSQMDIESDLKSRTPVIEKPKSEDDQKS